MSSNPEYWSRPYLSSLGQFRLKHVDMITFEYIMVWMKYIWLLDKEDIIRYIYDIDLFYNFPTFI